MRNLAKIFAIKDWDISIYSSYNGRYTDSICIVINDTKNKEELFKIEKFLEAVCWDDERYEWCYDSDVVVDYDNNIAYTTPTYGEYDYIVGNGEILGRASFEDKTLSFEDIKDMFVNNPEMALPSWIELPDEWEEQSCDFASGWYGRRGNPQEIYKNLKDRGHEELVFQIKNANNPLEIGFCVWTKKKEEENLPMYPEYN